MLDLLLGLASLSMDASALEDVFVSGRMSHEATYDTFRIPALCRTRRGTLLAFAEGRRSVADQAANVLVVRRRAERATSWGPLQIVEADEPNSLNNPCALATRGGRVWLMYQRYPKGYNERNAEPGVSRDRSCLAYVVFSDDDGKTWSTPSDISASIKGPTNRSDASGPGIGIELARGPHKGRLIFPFNEGTGDGHYDAFAVYSDNGGASWRRGADAPKLAGTNPNETQIAELVNGDLYLNARNEGPAHLRVTTISHDGGETWDLAKPDPSLPEPICQGSTLRLSFKPDILVFTNPNDLKARQNGTLRASFDGGKTWPIGRAIVPGSFGYSCLCPLSGTKVGLLYEAVESLSGNREGYRICYTTLDIPRP